MKQLPLVNSTAMVMVDDEDFDRLLKFKWYCTPQFSVQRYFFKRKARAISLACEIKQTFGVMFDHRDRNPLNFKKENLREASALQNAHNRKKVSYSTSKYKGVCRYGRKRWVARITYNGDRKHLGYFDLEEDAAKAYDKAAKELHKEFAVLNFMEQQPILLG